LSDVLVGILIFFEKQMKGSYNKTNEMH